MVARLILAAKNAPAKWLLGGRNKNTPGLAPSRVEVCR